MSATDLFRPNACPPAEVLVAYAHGSSPEPLLTQAADHLATCPACLETMRHLEGSDDSLIANLRRFVPEESPGLGPGSASAGSAAEGFATTVVQTRGMSRRNDDSGRPHIFAGYELLGELGRGGMGTVYKARQTALDRLVALKVIAADSAAGPESQARFRVEAKAVARLRHPHVVQIYDFGEENGQPYFTMEIMDGGSLKDRLAEKQQPERETAEMVRAMALGTHAAHQQHIVHRDLKPGNVLLDRDGTPKISDFSLAKLLDAEHSQTLTDVIMGTPAYMAPEQVCGMSAVGPLADVYSLGVILYEMLTGRQPFRGASRMETLDQVRYLLAPSVSRLRPGVAPDLEAVCSKCLEKDPLRRYPSAESLADDLGRWLRGESTQARPLSRAARVWRALQRHPLLTAAAGLVFVIALAAGGVSAYRDPERQRGVIDREIRKGGKVVLIGDTGKPRWTEWRSGEATAHAGLDPVGTFFLSSAFNKREMALLELASSTPRDSYRFEAEIRHDDNSDGGDVGLYFASQLAVHKGGSMQVFMQLTFNEIVDQKGHFPAAVIAQGSGKNPLYMAGRIYSARPDPKHCDMSIVAMNEGVFPPVGAAPKTWRKLTVEVTPQRVRIYLDDNWMGDMDPLEMAQRVADKMPDLIRSSPNLFAPNPVPPKLDFRGGLGLFVSRSSASYRIVTLEPME